MKILIIIPAYNEAENIERVIETLKKEFPEAEYLVVNDCSADQTAEICREHHFTYLDLPINLGIGGGVQAGYLYAVKNHYDIAVQMDGDGQHDPAYLPALLQPIVDGEADIVIGSRFIEKKGFQTTGLRRFGIRFLKAVIRVCCGFVCTDATSGFRAASYRASEFFSNNYAQDFPEPEAIVSAVLNRLRVREVPVIMNERQGGVSSINGIRSAYYMIKVSLSLIICRLIYGRKRRVP